MYQIVKYMCQNCKIDLKLHLPTLQVDTRTNSFKYVNILCVMCNIVKHICQNCQIDLSKFKILFGQPKVDTTVNSFKYVNIRCVMRQTSQRFI